MAFHLRHHQAKLSTLKLRLNKALQQTRKTPRQIVRRALRSFRTICHSAHGPLSTALGRKTKGTVCHRISEFVLLAIHS